MLFFVKASSLVTVLALLPNLAVAQAPAPPLDLDQPAQPTKIPSPPTAPGAPDVLDNIEEKSSPPRVEPTSRASPPLAPAPSALGPKRNAMKAGAAEHLNNLAVRADEASASRPAAPTQNTMKAAVAQHLNNLVVQADEAPASPSLSAAPDQNTMKIADTEHLNQLYSHSRHSSASKMLTTLLSGFTSFVTFMTMLMASVLLFVL